MLYGVGTDILKHGQLSSAILKENDPFFEKVYSKREQAEAKNRDDAYAYYCTRFAAKEAVFKALNIQGDHHIILNEIEVLSKESGQPYIVLNGRLKKIAIEKNIGNIQISISYDTDYFIAFVVIETDGGLI